MSIAYCVFACPCIVGVRGDSSDRSDLSIGAEIANGVVVCVAAIDTVGVCVILAAVVLTGVVYVVGLWVVGGFAGV